MSDYRAQSPATEPPVLPLSTQMRIAAEMAAPEIRGLAEMIGTEWQAEALRLEGAVAGCVTALREQATCYPKGSQYEEIGRGYLNAADFLKTLQRVTRNAG